MDDGYLTFFILSLGYHEEIFQGSAIAIVSVDVTALVLKLIGASGAPDFPEAKWDEEVHFKRGLN